MLDTLQVLVCLITRSRILACVTCPDALQVLVYRAFRCVLRGEGQHNPSQVQGGGPLQPGHAGPGPPGPNDGPAQLHC